MIINSIRAENVLKYEKLSIDLADEGLIAISGPNESGKSSVGETVCFALFGRTFSIAPGEIQKVVRWGENHCAVTLELTVEDEAYVLSRFLDRDGNHSAKLSRADALQEPIARGVRGVADALFSLLGFEYEEFVESFYLAQREITTPHPHSQAIKIMAGVAPFEQVVHSLDEEIKERQELIDEFKAEWDAVEQDVKRLGVEDGHLPAIEDIRYQTEQQLGQVSHLIEGITAGLGICTANTNEVNAIERAKGRASFFRFFVFLLAVAAAALWGLLTQGADLPQAEMARELLTTHVPQWEEAKIPWVGYLAIALGALFLLLWLRVAGRKQRIYELREESRQLGVVLSEAREVEIELVDEASTDDAGLTGPSNRDEVEVPEDELEIDMVALPVRPSHEEYEILKRRLDEGETAAKMAGEYCDRELAWLTRVGETLEHQMADLDVEIDEEQSRLQEAMNLSDVLNGLNDKREEVEERIEDRRIGLELLAGAVAELSNNFNRDVKELVGRMLPLFTDGHYEHLQIDEGLKVRVFSSDKRDFMDFEEVSSGTQRQIMLALRLALSKQLLSRTVKGKQFVFLDEPFAFFDQERTRRALHALAEIGDDVSQVWIVAQDFPDNCEVRFDTTINCDRNRNSLVVST